MLVYGVAPPGGLGEEFAAHRDALAERRRRVTAKALEAAGVEASVELVVA